MKAICCIVLAFLCLGPVRLWAQEEEPQPFSPVKTFEEAQKAGEALLTGIRHEVVNNFPCSIYELEIKGGSYVLQTFGNFTAEDRVYITSAPRGRTPDDLDPGKARYALDVKEDGWQVARVGGDKISLPDGKIDLYFFTKDSNFPLTDQLSITSGGDDPEFSEKAAKVLDYIKRWLEEGEIKDKEVVDEASAMVIPNPQGNYSHQVNESFGYSTFTYISLPFGVVTFETSNSTQDPVLHLFDPNNPDARSWTDDDSGPGLESKLTVFITSPGTYVLFARSYSDNANGVTKIRKNGIMYLNNTIIGRRRYMHTSYTGTRNFFTSYMLGDTRLFTLNSVAGNVRGYNDDYYGGPGTFGWGLRSRVKKNFPSAVTTTFICAYGTYSTGVCDTYMGNPNGASYSWFPNYKQDDCIQSAPSSGVYNCISWSGGITSYWEWPPSWGSSYFVSGNELASFDKFYNNTPKRYSGAWNYTRAGANVNNAVIDLWKVGAGTTGYTHASVKKPGNNNPHGYDWESKPGSLDRSFHPRNALVGPDYGSVTNYYIHNGTYAPRLGGQANKTNPITCDADAVRLGFDVFDNARLSDGGQSKLANLLAAVNPSVAGGFTRKYEAWQATWEKHAGSSNPDLYAAGEEYAALLAYSKNAGKEVLPLLFNRFLQGEFMSSTLLVALTQANYGSLMDEVKQENIANPTDERGRYIIHSTYGNFVKYIEKILGGLQLTQAPVATFTASVSPNPFKDRLNIEVKLDAESKVSITAASAQTGARVTVLRETTLPAGTHRYTANARQFTGSTGDIISVQVQVNGVTQTVKAIAGQ